MVDRSWTGPRIIALVCSAGGLDALRTVLHGLPADFPGAVIVLQHQAPGRHSLLPNILGRACPLPVHSTIDDEVLEPATVTVVPPGTHALATVDQRLALITSDGPPPARPSADLLLCSLAVTAGPRTVAVILSGGGRDGATGAVAVHDFGGTVIASDETTSTHFSMPSAAIGRDDAVDHVVPLSAIADLLVSLCGQPEAAASDATP